jgi:hypothetical protein
VGLPTSRILEIQAQLAVRAVKAVMPPQSLVTPQVVQEIKPVLTKRLMSLLTDFQLIQLMRLLHTLQRSVIKATALAVSPPHSAFPSMAGKLTRIVPS